MESEAKCSECGKQPAVACCFCEFPLPLVCSEHTAQHPMDTKGFLHFHLPLTALAHVQSKDAHKSFLLKLFKLHFAYSDLRENLQDIAAFEQSLDRWRQEIVPKFEAEVATRFSGVKERLAALRTAFAAEVASAVETTSSHALEQWTPEPHSLAALVWDYELDPPQNLRLFQGVIQDSGLTDGIHFRFAVRLKTLVELGVEVGETQSRELDDCRDELITVRKQLEELTTVNASLQVEAEELRKAEARHSAEFAALRSQFQERERKLIEERDSARADVQRIARESAELTSRVARLTESIERPATLSLSERQSAHQRTNSGQYTPSSARASEPASQSGDQVRRLLEEREALKAQNAAQIKRFFTEQEALKAKSAAEIKRLSEALKSVHSDVYKSVHSDLSSEVFNPRDSQLVPIVFRKYVKSYNLLNGECSATVLPTAFSINTVFCSVDEDTVICVGGYNPVVANTFYLSLSTNILTPQAPMLTPRFSPGIVKHGNAVYVFGGWDYTSNLKLCEKFDTTTKAWTAIAAMANPRSHFSPCVYMDDVYLPDVAKPHKVMEVYHPASDEFTVSSVALPAALRDFSIAFVHSDELVILSRDKQLAYLRLSGQGDFTVKPVTASRQFSGLTNIPPLVYGKEVYWVNHDTGALLKLDLDSAVVSENQF